MNFNSLIFLFAFLPFFFLLFYIFPKKYRYLIVLIGSLMFYFYSGLFNGILIVVVSIINYALALLISNSSKHKKLLLLLTILIDLGVLFLFKYSQSLLLPLGISFYTFNSLSYIVDVKRGKIIAEKNPLYYFTYSTLFCHVTMGPITNYETVRNNLSSMNPSSTFILIGFKRFLNGLIVKVLIADNLGALYNDLMGVPDKCCLLYWLCLIVFALQLFLDFSSYSNMAIGLGKMIGINYPENFNYPYLAISISDFWRKWHITLSNFFKTYVYFPMGGNRVSKLRHIFNLLTVWTLTGMWHGASWNFLIWGLYYGIILVIEKYFLLKKIEKWPSFLKHIYVLVIVLFGYVFFSISNFNNMVIFIKGLFNHNLINTYFIFYIKENILIIIISIILCFKSPKKLKDTFETNRLLMFFDVMIHVFLYIMVISYIVSGSYLPFLYNNF